MDIENLSKSQIILLTLLVSFVTSIATGIVTVTLMEQAPPAIAQTVNRVVERTIEKVVPAPENQPASAATVTEKTIIVKESDLIAQAVEKVAPSIVRLYTSGTNDKGEPEEVFLGLGTVLSATGVIVTDAAALPASGPLLVGLSRGMRATSTVIVSNTETGLAMVQGATSTSEGPISWSPAVFSSKKPTLGEVIVSIAGKTSLRISDGIITAFIPESGEEPTKLLETNVSSGAIVFGSPLINVDGEVEGLSTSGSRAQLENNFLASEEILRYTQEVQAKTGENESS